MMSDMVITDPSQLSAEWLTAALFRSGALTRGAVKSFEVETGHGNWSSHAILRLRYAAGSRGNAPSRLFLKMVNTDLGDEFFGDSEVTYYTRDYADVPDAPLVRCYDAAHSAELHRYHLLLDDVSLTHVVACTKPPTLEYGLALAEGLATLHARWWGEQKLAQANAPIHTPAHVQRFVDIAAPGVEHVLARFTADLPPHAPDVLRALIAHLPEKLIARLRDANGFTLIHGDLGCYNVLAPRDGERPLYFIDRQPFDWSLTTWLGVYDLVFATVLDWPIEVRRRHEMDILARYHQRLVEKGVTGYAWEQLLADYRLCVETCVLIPIEFNRGGVNEPMIPIWLPVLKRALAAWDDHAPARAVEQAHVL